MLLVLVSPFCQVDREGMVALTHNFVRENRFILPPLLRRLDTVGFIPIVYVRDVLMFVVS